MRLLAFLYSMLLFLTPAYALDTDPQKIQQIEDYLNNVGTLKASFVQTASNGSTAEGDIFIEKPNKIRM